MSDVKKHYREIDSLKGFAIFLVVLAHAIIYFPVNLHEVPWCGVLFKLVSGIHMPLFFAISGFCFSYRGNYWKFLSKKAKRLLLPYFVFNLLDLVPRALLPQFVNRPQGIDESVKDILVYGGAYWFLFTLFIIFAFYPLIYKWQAKSHRRQTISAICCLVLAVVRIPTEAFTLHLVSGYLFFFNLGVLLKMKDVKIFEYQLLEGRKYLPFAVAVLWLALLFSPWASQLEVFVSLLGVMVCYFVARLNLFTRIFERFGKFTLQLYLLNGFTLVFSRIIICRFTANPAIIVCFNMFIDFYVTYLGIKYICYRFKFFRILMGME